MSDQLPTRHGQACPYQVWTGCGRALCYKTFLTENPGFLPGFRIFPDFYWTKSPGVISGFQKTKVYKNPLRIVGGDSKQRKLFNNKDTKTHNFGDLYINNYTLCCSRNSKIKIMINKRDENI